MIKVLILGGTKDARILAELCVTTLGPDTEVITSLAGRTRSPKPVAGNLRIGGFGGATGLADYLRDEKITALVDATHPFASTISRNAAHAAQNTGAPHIMIERPTWDLPSDLHVTQVPSLEAAATALQELGSNHAFITTGINGLAVFGGLTDIGFLIRQIEDHEGPPPFPQAEIIVQKPPFDMVQERNTMIAHHIDALITKESGGSATEAKLMAAAELGIRVIMVERPALPDGERVSSPEAALAWIKNL